MTPVRSTGQDLLHKLYGSRGAGLASWLLSASKKQIVLHDICGTCRGGACFMTPARSTGQDLLHNFCGSRGAGLAS